MRLKATHTLNIFIAYRPQDHDKMSELLLHLQELQKKNRNFLVNKVWYDGSDLSDAGRAFIRELTENADIILLLMSDHSVTSAYFSCQEIRHTRTLHQQERAITIPVILNTCWWEDTIFKDLEVLPRAGLPIYDSSNVKNDLFHQLILELHHRIETVRQRKKLIEETFLNKMAEADKLFDGWEQHYETLRMALPIYKDALLFWREGFVPARELIEQRIEVCEREMDFRHYARAAHEAYKAGDYRAAYFNCKDALSLRDDAVIRHLYEKLDKQLQAENMRVLREPFDKHLRQGHEYFLSLQWEKAAEAYRLALEFHEPDFTPTKAVIQHKISICHREAILEDSLQRADIAYRSQRYSTVIDMLMDGIKAIHRDTFDKIERILHIVEDLEHVAPFCDQKTLKWGYFNKKTKAIIVAPKYLAAYNFAENLAGVKKWEKWGYIDIEGNEIIPFQYDFAGHFKNGTAEVIQGKESFFINHRGERVR